MGGGWRRNDMNACEVSTSSITEQPSCSAKAEHPVRRSISDAQRSSGLARRGPCLRGPVGRGRALFLALGGRRHDPGLGPRPRALPERGADAGTAGIAAADHDDMLARSEDLARLDRLAADPAVL